MHVRAEASLPLRLASLGSTESKSGDRVPHATAQGKHHVEVISCAGLTHGVHPPYYIGCAEGLVILLVEIRVGLHAPLVIYPLRILCNPFCHRIMTHPFREDIGAYGPLLQS
jgi:hypothetical protein